MDKLKKTISIYGSLWKKSTNRIPNKSLHFNKMQEVIPESIVRGSLGIEIGSGCGYDTHFMAKNNPQTKIVSLEISDGVFAIKKLNSNLKNVWPVKASALNLPMKDDVFDFAYSFGVLHHTCDPKFCLKEITRVMKSNAIVFLYLYEAHLENRAKYLALKIVNILRKVTTRIPPKVLYCMSFLASPVIILLFTYPYRILRRFSITRSLSEKIPFNFGTHPFSLAADIYDRFGAPIECRFSKQEIYDMFMQCGYSDVVITRLKDTAGWVVWGYKRKCL